MSIPLPPIVPVILSGGSGSRLWPLSRSMRPKQFIKLIDRNRSLFQLTLDRIQKLENVIHTIVVCNQDHRFTVAEQVLDSTCKSEVSILLEPAAKNTAPAIASAALFVKDILKINDAVLLVLPSDHIIEGVDSFLRAITLASSKALSGQLVTFGIKPTYPATGYGYIKSKRSNSNISAVSAFIEKPKLELAREFYNSGEYFWNSGIFLFTVDDFLLELNKNKAKIVACIKSAVEKAERDTDFFRLSKEEYEKCECISIDYAVMEHSKNVCVAKPNINWNDVGSWSSVWEISEKDSNGNALIGDVWTHNTENCYLHAENKIIAAVGIKDIVVVETLDGVMVTHKDADQDVKQIVEQLIASERPEALLHRKVYRPWGSYDSIDAGKRFQVKRITVTPGEVLSLQKHHHRAEHWIVVSGTAEVTKDSETFLLNENESTYIPLGTIHKLRNPGKIPLEIIEVQSGSYLGEDDIVRLEDKYGRTNGLSTK